MNEDFTARGIIVMALGSALLQSGTYATANRRRRRPRPCRGFDLLCEIDSRACRKSSNETKRMLLLNLL